MELQGEEVTNVLMGFMCPQIAREHLAALDPVVKGESAKVVTMDMEDFAHTAETMKIPYIILMNEWSDAETRGDHQEVHFARIAKSLHSLQSTAYD